MIGYSPHAATTCTYTMVRVLIRMHCLYSEWHVTCITSWIQRIHAPIHIIPYTTFITSLNVDYINNFTNTIPILLLLPAQFEKSCKLRVYGDTTQSVTTLMAYSSLHMLLIVPQLHQRMLFLSITDRSFPHLNPSY